MNFDYLILTEDLVQVQIHTGDSLGHTHDVVQFRRDHQEHPALTDAVEHLERCVEGAVVDKYRGVVQQFLPPSLEARDVGICNVCKTPVASDEAGIRRNGPLFYCKSHA